jgi:hypothetical protein
LNLSPILLKRFLTPFSLQEAKMKTRASTISFFLLAGHLSIFPPAILAAETPPVSPPAESKPATADLRKLCEADAKRLCPEVKPGGGRILRCLEAHGSDLSPGCRQGLAQRGK